MAIRSELVHYALDSIEDRCFTFNFTVQNSGWDGITKGIFLSSSQICYLLKKRINNQHLFKNVYVDRINLDLIAKEECKSIYDNWVREVATLNEPNQSIPLYSRMKCLLENIYDEWQRLNYPNSFEYYDCGYSWSYVYFSRVLDLEYERIKKKIKILRSRKYQFTTQLVTVEGMILAEKDISLYVTRQESVAIVKKFFRCYFNNNTLSRLMDDYEEHLNGRPNYQIELVDRVKWKENFFCGEDFIPTWSCLDLSSTLDAWEELIKRIWEKRITQDNIELYLSYLRDSPDLSCWELIFEHLAVL